MNYLTILLSSVFHIILVLLFEGIFLFVILYPVLLRIANNISLNINHMIITNGYGQVPVNITSDKVFYDILTPQEATIVRSGKVDENKYIQMEDKMPYIIYTVLQFSLIIMGIIVICVADRLRVVIDYKFILISSLIVFLLICGCAFGILWYSIFDQPYILDVNIGVLEAFLEIYNSA